MSIAKRFIELNDYLSRHGVSKPRAIVRYAWLALVHRYSPREILNYGVLLPEVPDTTLPLSKENSLRVLNRVNGAHNIQLTEDKFQFHEICRRNNLPAPRLLATVMQGTAEIHHRPDEPFPEGLVVKPADGAYGRDIRFFDLEDGSYHETTRGTTSRSIDTLEDLCRHLDADQDWVIEERVHPHPDLSELCGSNGLGDYRIGTFHAPGTSSATILFHYMRLPAPESLVANFAFGRGGSALVRLDPDRECIVDALIYNPDSDRLELSRRHPQTNVDLAGKTTPFYQEARLLALRAATCFDSLHAVGWDIAIGAKGLVLIEGTSHFYPPFDIFFDAQGWDDLQRHTAHDST